MPGRPLLFNLRSRNCSLCQSCLYSLRRQAARPWAAAYSSQASRKARLKPPLQTAGSIARAPSRAEINRYLQGIQALQGAKTEADEGGLSVRYFEQDDQGCSELPDEKSFGNSLSGFNELSLKEAFSGIKEVLETQEEKDVFHKVMRDLGGGLDELRSDEDVDKIMAKMQVETDSIDARIEEVGADMPKELMDDLRQAFSELSLMEEEEEESEERQHTPPVPQIPVFTSGGPWTLNQRRKISRLNTNLAHVLRRTHKPSGLTKKSIAAVYKAYHAARLPLAHGWNHVPIEVWDLLWNVFSADESININRMSHISLLARDMSEANVPLSPAQQILAIEAVFVNGWESRAIDTWKRCMGTLGDNKSEKFQDFWELGVRMFCRQGDMEQAERAVKKLLAGHLDARILMPLIRTLSEQGTPESQGRAWAAYRQMRELLGKDMKLSDYDQVVSYFLVTHQIENALYAFVDMMSDGEIDLTRHKYMPSIVANKFFVGKWLKRLIGAGDLDGALHVIEFMRSKGVEVAPIQANGLIGAWQRSGGANDLAKADKVAWAMIESRLNFVRARESEGGRLKVQAARWSSSTAPWPRATLETFCLLAENYRLRNLHDKMEALLDAFHDSGISPDAFMMNQLLESHIQAGQPTRALTLYHQLVVERGIAPDPYTFSALWKTLAVNRLHAVAPEALEQETEATRRLFEETVKFEGVFEPDGMDGQLARKILHTFRRLPDRAGFVVALVTLKETFKFLPPETLAVELVLGTTKLSWDTVPKRRRLVVAKRDMDRDMLAWAQGDAKRLEGQERGHALYEYLLAKSWPGEALGDSGKAALADAAEQMGVYELLLDTKMGAEWRQQGA